MKLAAIVRSKWVLACLAIAFAVGVLVRWWLLGASQGAVSADEAYTGLQALRILDGDVPLVIEGQAYTAVFDSYFLAPIFWLFGPSVLVLKLLPMVWWFIASGLLLRIAMGLRGRAVGVVTGSLFWVAPGCLIVLSTRAYEGYGIGVVAVLVACLTAQRSVNEPESVLRTAVITGAASGLAFYAHPMYAAVVLPLLLVPSFVHRAEWRRWWLPVGASALFVNVPLLVWNLRNDWATLDQPADNGSTYMGRLVVQFSQVIPRVMGLRDLDGSWTLSRLVVGMVLVAFAVLVTVGLIDLLRGEPAGRVVASAVVLCWPILAIFRNTNFFADGRYGIVFFPFVLVAFVIGLRLVAVGIRWITVGAVVFVVWCLVLIVPWVDANQGPRRGDPNVDASEVVKLAESRGFDSIAGSFWWVLPVEYLSDRRIRGGVEGEPLTVRLPDSQAMVESTPDDELPYVFSAGDEQTNVMRMPIGSYERVEIGDAVVYLPQTKGSG